MRTSHAWYPLTPREFMWETNDCAVRALRIVAEITYSEAHAALKAEGREDRDGTYNRVVAAAGQRYGLSEVTPGAGARLFPTIAQFARANKRGRFLIRTRTHFVALVNGVMHDWQNAKGPRTRVMRAWGIS